MNKNTVKNSKSLDAIKDCKKPPQSKKKKKS
jgi:hypothetical protein